MSTITLPEDLLKEANGTTIRKGEIPRNTVLALRIEGGFLGKNGQTWVVYQPRRGKVEDFLPKDTTDGYAMADRFDLIERFLDPTRGMQSTFRELGEVRIEKTTVNWDKARTGLIHPVTHLDSVEFKPRTFRKPEVERGGKRETLP